jgi:EmrB/QacA subfamily drug resistance transporter
MDRRWLVLSAVSVGTFMATLDGSIVNIALPRIRADLGIELAVVEWVSIAYLVVVGTVLLPFGRLGEVLTFRRVYLAGFALFTAASVLCGLAPGAGLLIGFRVLQGIGAGMLSAMGPAIVARTFGPGERGRALGLNSISVSLGLALGPVLGGLLTEVATWRAVFFVNLPIGIFAILWAARVLPEERRAGGQTFDLPGAALSGVALLGLLLALTQGESLGWTSPEVLALILTFLVAGSLFLWVEARATQPMVDLRLFAIRAFAAGNVSVIIAFAGLFTATFLLPFLLEDAAGYPPIQTGLLLTPVPILIAVVAPFSGALSDRIGSRAPASLGIAVLAIGLLALSQLPADFGPADLVWRLALIGVGMGLFVSPNSSAVLGSVPRGRIGTASGTLAQMRIDGQALGIAISGAIVAARMSAHLAELPGLDPAEAASRALALGIRDAFLIAALIASVGILTSLVRGGRGAAGMPGGPPAGADRSSERSTGPP